MLESRAMAAVEAGRAVLVNGMVRFNADTKNLGYNSAGGSWEWRGRQSGHGGPTVLQATRFVS